MPLSRRRQRKAVAHYTDDNPSTFTTKKPKYKKHESVADKKTTTAKATLPEPPKPRRRKRPASLCQSQGPPHATVHAHAWSIAPILAPHPGNKFVQSSSHRIFGKGLGVPRPLASPEWALLPQNPAHHSPIVCLASDDTESYLALGHANGIISIYSLGPRILLISQLYTSASAKNEAARLSAVATNTTATTSNASNTTTTAATATTSNATVTGISKRRTQCETNAIHAIAIRGSRIAISTATEVECIDALTGNILWTFPTPQSAVKLHFHPVHNDILLCSFATPPPDIPLLFLLQDNSNNTNNVTMTPILPNPAHDDHSANDAIKCAAIFDRSHTHRLLVVLTKPSCEQELRSLHCPQLRLEPCNGNNQNENTLSTTILHHTTIPNKTGKYSVEALSQSPRGSFTLVASTRGIRLFHTDTLQLIRVYGEGVALHGHTLVWQDCFFLPKSLYPQHALERDDELHHRMSCTTASLPNEESWMDGMVSPLVVGVPHAVKEPRELQDTLHVWHWLDGKQTLYTRSGPPKASGWKPGMIASQGKLVGVSHAKGELWQLRPTQRSDFPGVMYPPGYQLIDDNLVYIEDEDEVDQVVLEEEFENDKELVVEEEEEASEVDGDDLAEAMRRSIEESRMESEQMVQIVDDDDMEAMLEEVVPILPCHPESQLRNEIGRDDESNDSTTTVTTMTTTGDPSSPPSDSFLRHVLQALPHFELVKRAREKMEERPLANAVLDATLSAKPTRGKRSRASNLETILKASIDPHLRKFMISKERWADGEGSALRKADREASRVAMQVEAMNGNMIMTSTMEESKGTVDTNMVQGQQVNAASVSLAIQSTGEIAANVLSRDETDTFNQTGTAMAAAGIKSTTEGDFPAAIQSLEAIAPNYEVAVSALEGMLALHKSCSEDAELAEVNSVPFEQELSSMQANPFSSTMESIDGSISQIPTTCTDSLGPKEQAVSPETPLVAFAANTSHETVDSGDGQPCPPVVCPENSEAAIDACSERVESDMNTDGASCYEKQQSITCDRVETHNVLNVPTDSIGLNSAATIDVGSAFEMEMTVPRHVDITIDDSGRSLTHMVGLQELQSDLPSVSPSEETGTHPSPVTAGEAMAVDDINSNPETTIEPRALIESNSTNETSQKIPAFIPCDACLGRLVIHSCGKREVPIDFDAIAREEKEKREQVEEEKKKQRVEKRRLADAKRRETKRLKKKEEEEQKKRVEKERKILELQKLERDRRRIEEQSRLEREKDIQRAEMWQRLMATHDEQSNQRPQYQMQSSIHHQAWSTPDQNSFHNDANESMPTTEQTGHQSYHHPQPSIHNQDTHYAHTLNPINEEARHVMTLTSTAEQLDVRSSSGLSEGYGLQSYHSRSSVHSSSLPSNPYFIQQDDSQALSPEARPLPHAEHPLPSEHISSFETNPHCVQQVASNLLNPLGLSLPQTNHPLPSDHNSSFPYFIQQGASQPLSTGTVPLPQGGLHFIAEGIEANGTHDHPSHSQVDSQYGSNSISVEDIPRPTMYPERHTSAQLGTAEALTALANGFSNKTPMQENPPTPVDRLEVNQSSISGHPTAAIEGLMNGFVQMKDTDPNPSETVNDSYFVGHFAYCQGTTSNINSWEANQDADTIQSQSLFPDAKMQITEISSYRHSLSQPTAPVSMGGGASNGDHDGGNCGE